MSDPVDPHPIADSLERHLKDALERVPAGKRGQVTGAVTTSGVEASIGMAVTRGVTVSGWAGREWGGRGWSAGARGRWVF